MPAVTSTPSLPPLARRSTAMGLTWRSRTSPARPGWAGPWDALETWLRRFSGYVATKLAMLQGLNKDSEMFRVCRAAMYDAASPLFERARAAGEVRTDTNLDDVLRLVSGVTASHYESDAQRERVLRERDVKLILPIRELRAAAINVIPAQLTPRRSPPTMRQWW